MHIHFDLVTRMFCTGIPDACYYGLYLSVERQFVLPLPEFAPHYNVRHQTTVLSSSIFSPQPGQTQSIRSHFRHVPTRDHQQQNGQTYQEWLVFRRAPYWI